MLKCDKCGQLHDHPERYQRTCNRHQDQRNEKTGYCQGVLRPIAQFNNTSTWTNPGQGKKDLEHNQ